jgi:hypothetical protein
MLKLGMVSMVFYCFTNIIILRYLLSYYKLYIVVNPMNCYYIHLYIQMEDTYSYLHISLYITFWLVVSTPLKNSQLGLLFPIYGKIKNMFQTANQNFISRCIADCHDHEIHMFVKSAC